MRASRSLVAASETLIPLYCSITTSSWSAEELICRSSAAFEGTGAAAPGEATRTPAPMVKPVTTAIARRQNLDNGTVHLTPHTGQTTRAAPMADAYRRGVW